MRFELAFAPRIVFGPGALEELGAIAPTLGARPLLVVGGRSAEAHGLAERARALVNAAATAACEREPRVEDVERAVAVGRDAGCDAVIAVGGGAVLDCGKATAAMLTNPGRLEEYLEGQGGPRAIAREPLPFCAVPTTAGTGSEVTKNAVLSGPGCKRSIRSPLLVPRVALVDPELTRTLPPEVTAACGMDALTQLLEPLLSRGAQPVTDALALQGLRLAGRSLVRAVEDPDDASREEMALASLLGGICLANAGLGAVHGLAAPLGALFPIAHGVACAAVLPQVLRANVDAAAGSAEEHRLRERLAHVAEALTGARPAGASSASATEEVVSFLERLQRRIGIPRLGSLGVTEARFAEIVARARGSSMRYNPVDLSDAQLVEILRQAL